MVRNIKASYSWQAVEDGVTMYMPTEHVDVHDTQDSFARMVVTDAGSSDSREQETDWIVVSLSSSMEGSAMQSPSEAEDNLLLEFSREDSPETIFGDDDEDFLVDVSSDGMSTPKSTESDDLLFQLITAAATSPSSPFGSFDDRETQSSSEAFTDTGYATDRTDFREDTPSPSLRQNLTARVTRRRRSRSTPQPLTVRPVARILDFRRSGQASPKKTPASTSKALERKPAHRYTSDERELLCFLNRFYDSEDVTAVPKTFNAVTGLEVRHRVTRAYFWTHMCLYGPESFQAFSRVMSVPFSAPEEYYGELMSTIERLADNLNIDLRRRSAEPVFVLGKARKSKSPRVRGIYRMMVQNARQEAMNEAASDLIAKEVADAADLLKTMSGAVHIPLDFEELFSDAEQSPVPTTDDKTTRSPTAKPHLTFRVWDAANRTKFIDGSFVAHTFTDWPSPFPRPVALDDQSDVGKILTVLHLSKEGDTPVYISTASSLLQALSYATGMHEPRVALINLAAPSLQQENKVHHAADVFSWLKAQGLARWARYKGYGEYFIWSDIPSNAVLYVLELEELVEKLQNDTQCGQLLNLDVFEAGMKTNHIAAVLREKNTTLNTTTAQALGKIAKAFGLARCNMSLDHLQDFVARLMDGWTIQKPEMMDVHTLSSLAAAFATSLGVHAGGFTVQDVMGAFIRGVEEGGRCIAHWSRSGSGTRRRRFRVA